MANADYQKLCIEFARSLQEDLAALLGVQLRMRGPEIAAVDPHRAAGEEGDEPLVSLACSEEGGSGHSVSLVVPRADSVTLAGLLLALDEAAIKERRERAPDGETLGAITEVMNTAAAILSRAGEANGLPATKAGELCVSEAPAQDPDWIALGLYRRARWSMGMPDHPDARIDLFVPEATLTAWFGDALGEVSDASSADGGLEDEAEEGTTLVVIDASESDRDAVEALEEGLGLGVWAIDPDEIAVAGLDELADARGIIVDWELRHYGGLELLQALRAHPTTQRKRIALASGHPTRRMVTMALRHGANTLIAKPYRGDEIRARFGLASAEDSADEEAEETVDDAEAPADPGDEGSDDAEATGEATGDDA